MMAAPLILGNDIRKFINPDGTVDSDNKVLATLKNQNLIEIDQDKRGIQAKRIYTNVLTDILVKPLENRELAVCLLNKSSSSKEMSFSITKLHNEAYVDLPIAKNYLVKDLWEDTEAEATDIVKATVPSHGVKVFRIKTV